MPIHPTTIIQGDVQIDDQVTVVLVALVLAFLDAIVKPLLTIQQYALSQLRKKPESEFSPVYEKLVIRSLFGNTNASRNSA